MSRTLEQAAKALYIKDHESDNVAIIVNDNGLTAGTRFADGLELVEHLAMACKATLWP